MEVKEVKSLLKQAREAIKEKDFVTALKHCKNVLKYEKDNYNAWVFVGASAQEVGEPDQSEAAFKRAIEISPDQLLAWQGLCSFYEKHQKQEYNQELILVYKKLLDFQTEKEKRIELLDKLVSILRILKKKEEILKLLKVKLEITKGDEEEEYLIHKQVLQEFCNQTELSEEEKQMHEVAFNAIVSNVNFSEDDCRRLFSNHIEPLLRHEKSYALSMSSKVYEKFPNNLSYLEFYIRTSMSSYLENGKTIQNIEEHFQHIEKLPNPSSLHIIFKGFYLFISKKYLDAVQQLTNGLQKMEYCVQAWYFLGKSQFFLHHYADSEESIKTGIKMSLKSDASTATLGMFYLLLGQILSARENWDGALKSLEKSVSCVGQSKEISTVFCLTLLKLGQASKAERICQELKSKFPEDPDVLQLEGYAYFLDKQYEDALSKLRKSVSIQQSPFTLHLVGLVLWEMKQKEKAFKVFLKAAELDPFFAKNFMYMGHYYQYHLTDKKKACLCYQKAFELNGYDTEIGLSLSQVLQDLGKHDENIEILTRFTEKSSLGSARWAWTQLGLSQLQRNLHNDAIFSLQKALYADPSSSYGWECLADAYLKRGSYESAVKAYEKVSELSPTSMYPIYQVATIQKMRGFYTEAVEKFVNLLDIVQSYVPALIGLAETYILIARKSLDNCMYGLARDNCQNALNTLSRVSASKTGLSCLWKIAGDACTLPFNLDDKWFPIVIPSELLKSQDEEIVSCNKSQLLAFGSKFFGNALLIKEDVSSLWHDLGVSCYYQYQATINRTEKDIFRKKAFICLQKAITLLPSYEPHWTALGVISLSQGFQDCALGQHALIKSLNINNTNAETWTNLGVLYLDKGNIELSHLAFKMAQSAEPTYALSWLGQAFIADQVNHSETIDLYRHATILCSHNEALVGYARAVCEALLKSTAQHSHLYEYNIEVMNAIVMAGDCATKFVANNCNSPEAFNALGILLERQGIYNASLKAYQRSLELFVSIEKIEEANVVRANYARLLSIVGEVKDCLGEFLSLKDKDCASICSFALALYRDKQYEEAFKCLSQAFEKSKIPADKSHIRVAMAIMAMNMKGPNTPNPLSLLFESTQIPPASVDGLMALYAGGLLRENVNLVVAAGKELHAYKNTQKYSTHTAFLWAAHAHLMRGSKAARNEFLKFVHSFPSNAEMWLKAASCLLQWDSKYAHIASTCTRIGLFHGGSKELSSQIYALCQMSMGYRKEALSAAQKAVHINPGKMSNWATLAAACHLSNLNHQHVGWLFGFIRMLAKEEGIKADFLGWFIVMEIFHHINSGNLAAASALSSKVLAVTSFGTEFQSCIKILHAVIKVFSSNGDLQELYLAVKDNPKSFFGWNVLCQLLLVGGNTSEAEKTVSHFVITAEKIFPKWCLFPLLQLAVLCYKTMQTKVEEREKWLKLGEEVSGKAVHLCPSNQAARFLQGLFALETGNAKLAKRSFEKVLLNPATENKWVEEMAEFLLENKNLRKK